jgi:preprotein translocase subunit SecA
VVARVVEQSQHRIEGANFDVREHLLKYDDVLNQQRAQIYGLRDKVFTKEDLGEDIDELLQTEIAQRVAEGLGDEEGPWKLIAWLEQVQPPFMADERLFPSFGLSLLLKELANSDSPVIGSHFKHNTLDLITRAVDAENKHHLKAIQAMMDRAEEAYKSQAEARTDLVDTYFDGLRDMDELPRPQKMLEEVNALTGIQVKLPNEHLRTFGEDLRKDKEIVKKFISVQAMGNAAARLIASIQNRVGEVIGDKFEIRNWDDAMEAIEKSALKALERRRENLVGANSQIAADLDRLMPTTINDTTKAQVLLTVSQGARTVFDQKTHRQVKQTFNRFSYLFLIAQLLEGWDAEALTEEVLTHFDQAEEALRFAVGRGEYNRIAANASRLADFGPAAKALSRAEGFGEARLNETVASLGESDREALVESIGTYILNEVRRQLLLGATTELWVDYLTRIEALRVAIGLEAYAQRDPLVQYKSKASEMFAQLMEDIRGLVVSRAFVMQRRPVEITPVEVAESQSALQVSESDARKKKRRRH